MIELFDLRLVQTDPNFANYQYNAETGQVVLLDGASRRFKAALVRAVIYWREPSPGTGRR